MPTLSPPPHPLWNQETSSILWYLVYLHTHIGQAQENMQQNWHPSSPSYFLGMACTLKMLPLRSILLANLQPQPLLTETIPSAFVHIISTFHSWQEGWKVTSLSSSGRVQLKKASFITRKSTWPLSKLSNLSPTVWFFELAPVQTSILYYQKKLGWKGVLWVHPAQPLIPLQ